MTNRPNDRHDDMISAEAFTVEELRSAVFGTSQRVSPDVALMLLAKKDYPGKLDDLRRVLGNRQGDRRMRQLAAIELGRTRQVDAISPLLEALNEPDSGLTRSALEGLSLHGSTAALEAVEKMQERTDVGESARNLARLLRYRLNLPGSDFVLPDQARRLDADAERARAITTKAAEPDTVRTALDHLKQALTDVPLVADGATQLSCVGRDFLFVRRAEDTPSAAKTTFRAPENRVLVGILALVEKVESGRWMPHYFVLAQPTGRKSEFEVFVTSPRGTLELAGTAKVGRKDATFTVSAIDRPGAIPITIQGRFDRDGLHVERGLSELRSPRKQAPTLLRRRADTSE